MGFYIAPYQLCGLPILLNIYVSIKGSYSIEKLTPFLNIYQMKYKVYFSASPNDPVITEKDMVSHIQSLPTPADIYAVIYNNVKTSLDSTYGTSQQTLVFTDDL
jgi:hypothetical protein